MEVYLIRHTETIADKDVCYGQSDLLLKEPYLTAFENISKQINAKQAIIYSSPLKRCSLLAAYLQSNNPDNYNIKMDDRLKELNFGKWELKKWNEIEPQQLNNWMNDFVNNKTEAGESFKQLHLRVNDFIETTLLKDNKQAPAIVVTHAGVIRCFLCREQNIPLKDAFNFQVNYGSVNKINLNH